MRVSVVVPHPPGYIHAQALYDLATPLRWGLKDLGLDVVNTGEDRTIIVGPHLLLLTEKPPPDAILYNTEQVSSESSWLPSPMLDLYRQYKVWDYDPMNTAALRKLGVDAVTVPPGYTPALTRVVRKSEPDIDVLFFGSVNTRRAKILNKLINLGVNVVQAFKLYGVERDFVVARAKIVLNVHFYESKIFEAARVSYLLANRTFVVSEESEYMPWQGGYVAAPYDRLVDTCLGKPVQRIADRGFEIFSKHKAADMVRQAAIEAGLVTS